jgi:hypothetical protein
MNQEQMIDPAEQEMIDRQKAFEEAHPQMYDYVKGMADSTLEKDNFMEMAEFVNSQQTEVPLEGNYNEVHFRISGADRSLTAKVYENGRVTVSVSAND